MARSSDWLGPLSLVAACFLGVSAAACGGDDTPADVAAPDAGQELVRLDVMGSDPGDADVDRETADDGVPRDVEGLEILVPRPDVPEDRLLSGEFGWPCRANGDCLSGYCVDGEQGPVCTKSCQLDCPTDWVCRASLIGSDIISLCIPLGADLCKPCQVDTQCGDGACITVGAGTFCGRACTEVACPPGFDCREVPTGEGARFQCVPHSGACDCLTLSAGARRPCARKNADGTCLGFETCDPQQGWLCDAKAPGPETCNGLDDNCNSLVDEAFPEVGAVCWAGEGQCRRQGTFACRTDGTGVECSAGPGQTLGEVCDYLDNDCNGQTDEGFKTGAGEYATDRACGNCYVDCTAIFTPARHHATGRCDATGEAPRCTYACESGFADSDGNPDNGCELTLDPLAVFVSTTQNGGRDNPTCGAWDAPCATIAAAIARAVEGSKRRVLVSEGIYAGNVTLVDGVSLLGGHNAATWQREPANNITILQGSTPEPSTSPHRKAVVAIGITTATEMSGFTIYGENCYQQRPDGRGGNSYALWIKDSGPDLQIRGNVVYAGRGAQGASGANGSSGDNGDDGADGAECGTSGTSGECEGVTRPGGDPGASACGASGGRGGDSICPDGVNPMDAGARGEGPAGGEGGAGGWSDTVNATCTVCSSQGKQDFGFDGGRGGPGDAGSAGRGCTDENGDISGSEWLSALGTDGGHGVSGSGGGGAGAGGGVSLTPSTCGDFHDRLGSAGGGGGAGGCGGLGGDAGKGGGASIGIFVLKSESAPAILPTLRENLVLRNQGGAGGQGGSGGVGGVGGVGGQAGGVDCAQNSEGVPYWFNVCIGKGGTGGNGGQGGAGGGGGGGCGGPSWGILGAGVSSLSPDWCASTSGNTFDRLGDGGPGGEGGNSAGAPGTPGEVGSSADCRIQ